MISLREDVRLAELSLDLAPEMYRWAQDPFIAENIGLRKEPSLEKTRKWIEEAIGGAARYARSIWIGDQYMGNAVLDFDDGRRESARFSIYIGEPRARRLGAGLTASYRILREAFGSEGLKKAWLHVHVENEPAFRMYQKLGFRVEKVLPDSFSFGGRLIDARVMVLTSDRFPL